MNRQSPLRALVTADSISWLQVQTLQLGSRGERSSGSFGAQTQTSNYFVGCLFSLREISVPAVMYLVPPQNEGCHMREVYYVAVIFVLAAIVGSVRHDFVWTSAAGGPLNHATTCPHCGGQATWLRGEEFDCYQCDRKFRAPRSSW